MPPRSAVLIDKLTAQLDGPRDGPLLRYSLANAHASTGDRAAAVLRCREALAKDPDYSAAWKLLGKLMAELGDTAEAIRAYEDGIAAAQRRGDRQAEKEMRVFCKRLKR